VRGPRRLNEESELFAKLVADMKRDRPSPEPLEKLVKAISAMPDVEPKSAKFGGKNWLVFVGAGMLAAVGVAVLTARPFPVGARSASGATAAPPASEVVVAGPPPAGEIPSAAVAELPDVPSPAASSAQGAATGGLPPSAASRPPSSRQEFEIIVAARRALTRSDASQCLSLVAQYQREFPTGQFALEAKVMRVEATAARGERGRAAALARDLLAREPENPYETRLRSLLTSIEDER